MNRYDLVVIGAGPAGYAAAMRALDFRKRVLLIEKGRVGGVGIANGALSSKTWWEISREIRIFNNNLKRYNLHRPEINLREIREEVTRAIEERTLLLEDHIELLMSSEAYRDYLFVAKGKAKIIEKHIVEITNEDTIEKVYGENIILATGSKPRHLPGVTIDEKTILTSDGIEHMSALPKSIVIVGAGVVGCEYATILSSFSNIQVNLIDKGNHILPYEDPDVVSIIERNLEIAGVRIHRNSVLSNMEIKEDKVKYELNYTDGSREIFHVEKALISIGREANYEGLWSENIPIKINERGIEDNDTRTSIPNIYAVGDLTNDIALVNVGELEGRHAVEKIFGGPVKPLLYENISTIMFFNPEVAGVGLNEIKAQAKNLSYRVALLDYSAITRAIAKRNTQGFIKLLVTDDDAMKVLGMRVVGIHASSAIQAVALLISMDKGIEELAECVHPHPSITEGIQECVRMLLGKSMMKPDAHDARISCKRYSNGVYENLYNNLPVR